jgi:MFS family permease
MRRGTSPGAASNRADAASIVGATLELTAITADPPVDGADSSSSLRCSAFVPAVISLVVVFATVGSTIPLFNIYRAEEGFTNGAISMTVVAYSVATLVTLLVFGRLSHHVGRRPVAITSLLLLVAGSLVLLDVHHIGVLIAGRVLMGIGAGLASSSMTSYIVDAAPAEPAWLASVASSQTVMLGLAVGAVTSGALVEFAPWPRDLIFLVEIVVLLLSIALIAVSRETVPRTAGAWTSLRPQISAPAHARRLLPVAAAVLLATWAMGSFYQAFVPALVEGDLHTQSSLILGLVFGAYMACSALGAPLSGMFDTTSAQRLGMVIFLLGVTGLIAAIAGDDLPLFFAATVLAGAGQGIAISSTTRGLLYGSTIAQRAPLFSVIYLLSYGGATVPILVASDLASTFSLSEIALGYGALALVAAVMTLIAARNPHLPRQAG